MKVENIFAEIPKMLKEESFQHLAASEHVKIERIVSRGHTSPETGWYDQEKNEWVMVLEGKAVLSFIDEPPVTLNRGDYLIIPAHKKHRVDWTEPDKETVWLAVHYE